MKKIIILFLFIFFSSCSFFEKEKIVNENIKENKIQSKLETTNSGIVDGINNRVDNKNKFLNNCSLAIKDDKVYFDKEEINYIYSNYKRLKKIFTGTGILELDKEYYTIKGFATKNCEIIREKDYAKKLCDIYMSGDYSKLDNFKFEGGETKEETIKCFNNLKKGISNGDKSLDFILNFEKYKKNIVFDFKNIEKDSMIYYIYAKEIGKEKFLKEMDKAFLNKCKRLVKK